MSRFSASIAGHLGPGVGILAPTVENTQVLSPNGSTALILRPEGSPIISLPLGTLLFNEVMTALLHCSFYVDRSVIQVNVRGILSHRHSLLDGRIQLNLKSIHLHPFVSYEGWGKM